MLPADARSEAGSRRLSPGLQRVLTAAVGAPLAIVAAFRLPGEWFFAVCALVVGWASLEFVALARVWAPRGAPLKAVPALALALAAALSFSGIDATLPVGTLAAAALVLSVGLGSLVLLGRTPVEESLPALGALAFGVPYFALPLAGLYRLQQLDPWLVVLLAAIVWLGDSAAFYAGSAWGRRRLAPVVSPKKTWTGATAGLVVGLGATAAWSAALLGRLEPIVLAAGLATAVAAQLGDLVESMIKRGAGVKDSGNVLPGHGGMLDRADALLFAAPVLWAMLWWLGPDKVLP